MTGAVEAGNAPTAQMSGLFRIAVIAGAEQAVRLHISRGDDLNARDAGGMTALMLASSRDKAPICRLLLEAGADPWLTDRVGRTALEIAVSSGATKALAIFAQLTPQGPPSPVLPPSAAGLPTQIDEDAEACETAQLDDDDGFGSWEAEPEMPPPQEDQELAKELANAHRAITAFIPFDNSADWDNSDLLLPERAAALLGSEDAEARAELRLVLLRALREGSVPDGLVEEIVNRLGADEDGSIGSAIRLAIWDFGAECDERLEFEFAWENFKVHVDPEGSGEEEESVSEALAQIESNVSTRSDPLRAYQREFQRVALLSAEEEVKLAQAMEAAVADACGALARWPDGIRRLLADIATTRSGERALGSLVAGPSESDAMVEVDEQTEVVAEEAHVDAGDAEGDRDAGEGSTDGVGAGERASFEQQANEIESLASSTNAPSEAIEERVLGLNLARSYLVELLSLAELSPGGAGREFLDAMEPYLRARDAMARGNLRLAFSIAKRHLYSGMELADLAQEANMGLLKAVDKFDWRRGFKFSTYATWWIRQQASRSIADKGRQIRLPVHVHEQARRAAWEAKHFEDSHGRSPTSAELGEILQLPAPKAQTLLNRLRDPEPIDEVDITECISADFAERFVAEDPELLAERRELARVVHDALDTLKTKESRVICLRFGIGNDAPLTLEEVGAKFEVTRERIRQIEATAMRNLKHPSRMGLLRAAVGRDGSQRAPAAAPSGDRIESVTEVGELDGTEAVIGVEARIDDEGADGGRSQRLAASGERDRVARAIELANRADVVMEDDRPSGGSVWFYITRPHDAATRALVRELIRVGFELWPGKGYWL